MNEAETKQELGPPSKKSFVKKFVKFILYTILGFVVLNVLIYALLSIPFIQQKLVNFAVNQLKNKLNTEIAIDEVRIRLFNHAVIKGIYIEDQQKDTLLYANHLDVSLSPWQLIKNQKLEITSITLDDFVINVNKKDSISDFNFQFVIDAFASSDTVKVDTTKSALTIQIGDIDIKHGRLRYDVLSAPSLPAGLFDANHSNISDFNANVDLNSLDADRLDIALNSLSLKERSGLEIRNLTARYHTDHSKIWVDGLSLTMPNSHFSTKVASFDSSSHQFELVTDEVEFSPSDLQIFSPGIKFLQHSITADAHVKGTLPEIKVEKLNIGYGGDFTLDAKASIDNYERYATSKISLNINTLKIKPKAIVDFAKIGDSTFSSIPMLDVLGDIRLKAVFSGQLSRFRANIETWCRQGNLNLTAHGAVDSTFTRFDVNAGISTQSFNLVPFVGKESGVGRLSAALNVKAKQTNAKDLSADVVGSINSIEYQDQVLRNIPFEAFYDQFKMGLSTRADLPLGKLKADVEMTQEKVPDIKAYFRVDNFHVDRFYKNDDWIDPRLSLCLHTSIKGLDIDYMTGKVRLDSIDFHDANFKLNPDPITFEVGKKDNGDKFIAFNSAFLNASVRGKYKFASLGDEFGYLLHSYFPAVFPLPKRLPQFENDFLFDIYTQNTATLDSIFKLPVNLSKPAHIFGHINTINRQFDVRGKVPDLFYGDMHIKDAYINSQNHDSIVDLSLGADMLMDQGLFRLSLYSAGKDNRLDTRIYAKTDSAEVRLNGGLNLATVFERTDKGELATLFNIVPSNIQFDDYNLSFLPATIAHKGERTTINNFGITLNNKPYFAVDGAISDHESDTLKVSFDRTQVGDLLQMFNVKDIYASINGNILVTGLMGSPRLYTDNLSISDIIIVGDTLGDMSIRSRWNEKMGGVRMNAALKKSDKTLADIKGIVYTNKDSLNVEANLDRFPVEWAKPFAEGILNKLSGSVSMNLKVTGSSQKPILRGFLGFNNVDLGIDYTNVTYNISDTIQVSPDRIGFDRLKLRDPKGNTADIKATITHQNFSDMKYVVDMTMKNLMVLNTAHRTDSLFYGQVFASGNLRINGDPNGVNLTMQLKNEKNSSLDILIPQVSQASEYQSVVFINVPEEKVSHENENKRVRQEPFPMKMNIKLEVTPDIRFGVVINPVTGDAMQVRGRGNLNFAYDMKTDNMQLFGDYIFTDGSVRLNLKNLSKLEFRIREGSKLKFIGDPLKTNFDITAFRRVRADLRSLDESFATEQGTRRVAVDCELGIKGNMNKMDLTYDIVLPDASDHIQRRVSSIINTEEQKVRQFAYLVISGTFYSNTSNSGASFSDGMWTNLAASTLSSGLTSLVGGALGDKWEIGANIDSNNGTFSDVDMTVNVSTKLFDDRLKLNTNLGYRSNQVTPESSSFIGDFDVEYQLSQLWTLKVYNRTNDQFYRQAPTTQGVGIVYTKDGRTLKQLFQTILRRQRPIPQSADSLKVDTSRMKLQEPISMLRK